MDRICVKISVIFLFIFTLLVGVAHACAMTCTALSMPQLILLDLLFVAIFIVGARYPWEPFITIPIFLFLQNLRGGDRFVHYEFSYFLMVRLPLIIFTLIMIYKLWVKYIKLEKKPKIFYFLSALLLLGTGCLVYFTVMLCCSPVHCNSALSGLGIGLEMYSADHNGKYPATLEELRPEYFKEIPTCDPEFHKGIYKPVPYAYEVNSQHDSYTIRCRSRNHEAFPGYPRGYPYYTSTEGLIIRP